jgi:hypothetical protein
MRSCKTVCHSEYFIASFYVVDDYDQVFEESVLAVDWYSAVDTLEFCALGIVGLCSFETVVAVTVAFRWVWRIYQG